MISWELRLLNPQNLFGVIWGCAKRAVKRACGKTVVQTPKNGQQQALNQNPAAGKIHTFWINATCNSRLCVLDASEQKTNSLELTDGLPRHGLSDWDKVTKDERSVLQFSHLCLEQNTRTSMKTRMDSSKHSEAICVRDAGKNPQFSWTTFPHKNCTLQNLPRDSPKRSNGLSVLLVDCPFCGKAHFWRKFQLSNQ